MIALHPDRADAARAPTAVVAALLIVAVGHAFALTVAAAILEVLALTAGAVTTVGAAFAGVATRRAKDAVPTGGASLAGRAGAAGITATVVTAFPVEAIRETTPASEGEDTGPVAVGLGAATADAGALGVVSAGDGAPGNGLTG